MHAHVHMCVAAFVKNKQICVVIILLLLCCNSKKELKGLRSDDSCSDRGFEQNFLSSEKKKTTTYFFTPAVFKSWDAFVSVKR